MRHACSKPFGDPLTGRYLIDLGVLLGLLGSEPKRVLDLGCGVGWTSRIMARSGHEVTGIDLSPEAIASARSLVAEEPDLRLTFVVADYEGLEVEGSFDAAVFYDALHHAENEEVALRTAYRALRRGGVLIAFEPGSGHGRSPGAKHAVQSYGVQEKDMPPRWIWTLGRRVGFRRAVILPGPHDLSRAVYRRDFALHESRLGLWMERLWGLFRLACTFTRAPRSGMILMVK